MPKLVFIDKNFAGRVYELVLEKTTIGRADSNTLVIHDPSVSVNHCIILTHGAEVIVRDTGSKNGTFVNGIRINGQSQIKAGQTVRFGSVEARLDLEEWTDADDQPETAVITLKQIMRDQRRAAKHPKPNPAQTLDPSAPIEADEMDSHTVLIPRRIPTEPLFPPEEPSPVEKPAGFGRAALWIVLGVVAVLGLLLWLFWGN